MALPSPEEIDQMMAAESSSGGGLPSPQEIDQMMAMERASLPFSTSPQLGPDYNRSFTENLGEGVSEAPSSLWNFGSSIYSFLNPFADGGQGGPIDTMMRAGPEATARTAGAFGAGTAGAITGAGLGASAGAPLAPFTFGASVPIGALLGGAAGGAAGLFGFDVAADVASDNLRPTDEYLKDFAYNLGQGAITDGATSAVSKLAKVRPGMNPFGEEAARGRVATQLQEWAPGLSSQIDEALALEANNPFINNVTTGELIDNPMLQNAQRTMARGNLESYGKSAEAYRNRGTEQLKWLEQIENSSLTPADVQDSIRTSVDQTLGAKEGAVSQADIFTRAALETLPAPIESVEAGGIIREGLQGAKDVVKGQVSEAFGRMGTGVVDPTPARIVADQLMPTYFKKVGAQPDSDLVALVNDLTKKGAESTGILNAEGLPITREIPYTIQDIQAMRSKALDIANKGDLRTSSVAGEIAEALRVAQDNAVKAGTVTKEEAAALNQGRELRKTQGTLFESSATPAKSVLAKQPYGEFKVPESAIPSKYFKPGKKGSKEAIRNYKETIGLTDEALDPIYRYATDSFRDYAVTPDGLIDAGKARKWMARHSDVLDELPQLRQQFSNVERAQSFLNEKFGDLKRTQSEIEKGALKQFLQVDPDAAISSMFSGKDMGKKVNSLVQYLKANDPDAVAGLRRGVIEHLKKKAFIPNKAGGIDDVLVEGGQFSGDILKGRFTQEWSKLEPVLKKSGLYTESQLKGFEALYGDMRRQISTEKAKMPGGSDTAQNASTLASLLRLAGGGYLKSLPGVGKYLRIAEPILSAIPQAKYLAILEDALLNPRYARDLMTKATTKNLTRNIETIFKEQLRSAFGAEGANAVTQGLGLAASVGPVALQSQTEEKPAPIKPPKFQPPPSQQKITSQKSFPTQEELLRPPTKGTLNKSSFNLQGFLKKQSLETQARIQAESNFNPAAVSKKGAQGLSQLMPETAQEIAGQLGETYMPLKPGMTPEQQAASIKQNVRFGDHYYKQQLKKYGNTTLAWAAYNAGPRRVDEAIAKAGTSRDVNAILSNLPSGVQKETVPYVNKISSIISRLT